MTVLTRPKRPLPFSISKQLSNHFFKLPPACRSFHASPQPNFFEDVVSSAQYLFDGIHSATGLPWAYSIPLTALAIRTTLILPLGIYARRTNQEQMALSPLIYSWTHQLRRETMREVGHLGPVAAQRTLVKKMRKKRNEIYSRWGCGTWKTYLSWMQLPVWLTAIEAVRKMCGKESGLLGLIFGSSSEGKEIQEALRASGVELTLADEGALWFPNLLAPDPMLLLPFMLSGVMFLSLSHNATKNPSVGQRRVMNTLKIVALAVGPLTLQVPSAMLVYWISSSSLALGQAFLLEKLIPVKPPVVPCKPRKSPV